MTNFIIIAYDLRVLKLFKASSFTFKIRNFPSQQCVQKATYLISLPLGKTELKATQSWQGRMGGSLSLLPLCLTGIPPPKMALIHLFSKGLLGLLKDQMRGEVDLWRVCLPVSTRSLSLVVEPRG